MLRGRIDTDKIKGKKRMGEEENGKTGRPRWFKIVIILFVCYTVCVFAWLGFLVMTGDQEGPIPEKYSTAAAVCVSIVILGPFCIVILDVSIKIIRRMKKWAEK